MRAPRSAPIVLTALAAACSTMLPNTETEVRNPWHSFAEAKAAIERIEPDRTTVAELHGMGIDPYSSPNVQLLSYSDVLLRFPFGNGMQGATIDEGLRECLQAGKACSGYAISVHELKRDRVGNFWQDTFGFKRVVEVTGWTFNALILIKEGHVIYTLYGGQPNVREQEVTRQPLGPVQNLGEAVPKLVP